jgi:serine/threonine protein phosphatase PrpC
MKNTLSRTLSRHLMGSGWMQRFVLHPVTQLAWQVREPKFRPEASRNCLEGGPSESEYVDICNLQWAHGKAGEDRVHVVLCDEQGWLFIGIYDGFSGPDAPDFLMSHLHRAIDRELEGLLWDYEDKSSNDPIKPKLSKSGLAEAGSECSKQEQPNSSQTTSCSLNNLCSPGDVGGQSSNCEIVDEIDVRGCQQQSSNCEKPSSLGPASASIPTANLTGKGRKSVRLYELLQMESCDGSGSASFSVVKSQRSRSWNCQPSSDALDFDQTLRKEPSRSSSLDNCKGEGFSHRGEDPTTSGEDGGIGLQSGNQGGGTDLSVSVQRQGTRKFVISSKIRKMYRKQKSLRKKLFPWSYDWHREETCADERVVEPSGPIRRWKTGIVDHDAVLRAMARGLQHTEEQYMEMVEKDLDRNAELALMGSCVLVMLMKDQDVYVMNLGDSRAILAQERPNDRHPNPTLAKDDMRYKNRSREFLVRMELDRISEEFPMHNHNSQVNMINKNREISICRLKMRAVQLSTDHSTSIEEVCFLKFSIWLIL